MKFKRRYSVVAVFVVSLVLLIFALLRYLSADGAVEDTGRRRYVDDVDVDYDWRLRTREWPPDVGCRISNCFNATPCRLHGFRVYVYPDGGRPASDRYAAVLRALRSSRYYTEDPERACLFVLSIDTLDRDRLSNEYVPNIQSQIDSLRWWRGGVNHVVFNLYSGTWPDYTENGLGFDVGKAMLAKASISRLHYRTGFDISFPLFHKELKFYGGEPGALSSGILPPYRKYVLSFKGKRYLTGIGSETRNSLYHIHNGDDIILLTTCRHGKGWEHVKDERCEKDNQEYDRYDVNVYL